MRSNDTFKSSGSIDTTINAFIDIPQDDNQASLTLPDRVNFIRDDVDGKLKINHIFSNTMYINCVLVTNTYLI